MQVMSRLSECQVLKWHMDHFIIINYICNYSQEDALLQQDYLQPATNSLNRGVMQHKFDEQCCNNK